MKEEDFVLKLKDLKKGTYKDTRDLKVIKYSNRHFKIYKNKIICSKCKTSINQELEVKFKIGKEYLTMFEGYMLFMVFVLGKKPEDYASYHKCIAGKRFIEDIEEINI